MANTAIQKISARAKQIQRSHPSWKWMECIKASSKEYNAGKLGKVKRPKQTGTSNTKRDKQRKAKPPGKRRAKSGRVYTERRKNRSDAPGKVTGLGSSVPGQLRDEMQRVHEAEAKLYQLRTMNKRGLSSMQRAEIVRQRNYWIKDKKVHRKNIINLKRLI